MRLATIALPLLAAACTEQTDETASDALTPITLTADVGGGPATRASQDLLSTDLRSRQFYAYFPDGVTIGSATSAAGTPATVSSAGDRVTLTTQPYLQAGLTSARVYAYFPYQPGTLTVTNDGVSVAGAAATATFSVQRDQSTDANYVLSDLMAATGVASRSGASAWARLTFQHLMVKLVFNVSAGQGISSIKSVRLISGVPSYTLADKLRPMTGGTAGGTAFSTSSPLTVYSNAAGARQVTAACLVPPQSIAAGNLLEVETNLGTATYSVPNSTFAGGYTYTVGVTTAAANLDTTTALAPWNSTTVGEVDKNLRFHVGGVPFNMVYVEGGDLASATKWAMTGTLGDYYMAETEVTQALWKAVGMPWSGFASDFTANFQGDAKPVCSINEAQAFQLIAAVNRATAGQRPAGTIFYMPSLEQWRWAFNGGIHNTGTTFAGSNNLKEVGWNNWGSYANSGGHHHDVALLKPNALGLYDMSGNIGEMCLGTRYYDNTISRYRWIYYEGGSSRYKEENAGYYKASTSVQAGDPTSNNTWGPRLCLKPVSVGDLYFSDGSWGTKAEYPNKTPIGIVFHVGTSAKDQALGYFGGYVMALKDANTSATSVAWSTTAANYTDWQYNIGDACNATQAKTLLADLDGLTHCRTARCYRDDATNAAALPAMAAAKDYATATAPKCSSGWYLPSIGQQLAWIESFSTSWNHYSYVFPSAEKLNSINNTASGNFWSGTNQAIFFDCEMTDMEVIHAVDTYIQGKLGTSSSLYTPLYVAGLTVGGAGVGWHSSTEQNATYSYSMHYHPYFRLHFWGELIAKTASSGGSASYMLVRPVLAF